MTQSSVEHLLIVRSSSGPSPSADGACDLSSARSMRSRPRWCGRPGTSPARTPLSRRKWRSAPCRACCMAPDRIPIRRTSVPPMTISSQARSASALRPGHATRWRRWLPAPARQAASTCRRRSPSCYSKTAIHLLRNRNASSHGMRGGSSPAVRSPARATGPPDDGDHFGRALVRGGRGTRLSEMIRTVGGSALATCFEPLVTASNSTKRGVSRMRRTSG